MPRPDPSLSRLEPLPNSEDLGSVLDFLRTQRALSAINRKSGDEAKGDRDEAQAAKMWETPSQQNLHALAGARSYLGFTGLFDVDGSPVRGRNYPLEGQEAEFVKMYCDSLGRQGGLFRRLGDLSRASEYYRLGSLIEARSADLAFENSYNTLNAISIMIEMGLKSASPLAASALPDVQNEIITARKMVGSQVLEGKRGNDAWAMADLAMAIMLSNDATASKQDVPVYYDRYAAKADIDDIQTTLRILRLLLGNLRQIGDPVANLIEQGISQLHASALKADKNVD